MPIESVAEKKIGRRRGGRTSHSKKNGGDQGGGIGLPQRNEVRGKSQVSIALAEKEK